MSIIRNLDKLATTPTKRDALTIAEAGFRAIDTYDIVRNAVRIENSQLIVSGHQFTLKPSTRIRIIGFGKASCKAAEALELSLADAISSGVIITNATASACQIVESYQGTHPRPSPDNVLASAKLVELAQSTTEDDIVLVIVSGGGSALLCWPESESIQGERLYKNFLSSGGTIHELNTVRKHISHLKGGGLAKLLYPAKVVSLIFSDVPGGAFEFIASGPTYYDHSTTADAEEIIAKYNLGNFDLVETPKDQRWFENVTNIPLVSNQHALTAMQTQAEALGYEATILGHDLYDDPRTLHQKMLYNRRKNSVILAGGEARITVPPDISAGKGGRNTHSCLQMASLLPSGSIFASVASDGIDNSHVAGACIDHATSQQLLADPGYQSALDNFDSLPILERQNSLILTGNTEANVSDLYLLLTEPYA